MLLFLKLFCQSRCHSHYSWVTCAGPWNSKLSGVIFHKQNPLLLNCAFEWRLLRFLGTKNIFSFNYSAYLIFILVSDQWCMIHNFFLSPFIQAYPYLCICYVIHTLMYYFQLGFRVSVTLMRLYSSRFDQNWLKLVVKICKKSNWFSQGDTK